MSIIGYTYISEDGFHANGVGYAPDGTFCGECLSATCEGCKYATYEENTDIAGKTHENS